jgi:hypothetical protein
MHNAYQNTALASSLALSVILLMVRRSVQDCCRTVYLAEHCAAACAHQLTLVRSTLRCACTAGLQVSFQ